MKKFVLCLLALASWGIHVQARELLDIKGDYLLYSYDYNYVYGQGNVLIKAKDFTIQAASVEIDMANRLARLSRNCRVQAGKENYTADILEIDLNDLSMRLTTYKDSILSWTLPAQKGTTAGKDAVARKMVGRDFELLKKSLVYFLNGRIVITGNYRLYGYQCMVFIEGIQSLAFKKFKLDKGIGETSDQGFGLEKIWLYPSQGVVINSRLLLEKAVRNGSLKSVSKLDLIYDIFSAKDEVIGSRGKINFNSLNSLPLGKKSGLYLNANFLSDNMLNASLDLKTQWTPQFSSDLMAEYSLTAARREELWLRLRSAWNSKLPGNLSLNLAYEKEKQYVLEMALRNQAVKNFVLSAQLSRSRLLYGESQYNDLSNSAFSLAYTNKLFNLAADYSFHKDLLLEQSQGSPQFRLNISPFTLYNGLLRANFFSSFIVNQLNNKGHRDDFSKVNMGLSLQSEKIQLGSGPELSFSMAAEQLLDQDPQNNFTSLGTIFTCGQSLSDFADFNFLFNYQTRRKTEKWFIQGTTSQDWSAVLKLKEKTNRVQGWISLSYDTKSGRLTSGLLDCSVAIIKNWHLQTQMNYDFVFKNFSYDLYLIRRAGRIMIRGSYRSLSKQFLLGSVAQLNGPLQHGTWRMNRVEKKNDAPAFFRIEIDPARPAQPQLPPLFRRPGHFFDRFLDAAGGHGLAGIPPDRFGFLSRVGGFFRPGAGFFHVAPGRSPGRPLEPHAHHAGGPVPGHDPGSRSGRPDVQQSASFPGTCCRWLFSWAWPMPWTRRPAIHLSSRSSKERRPGQCHCLELGHVQRRPPDGPAPGRHPHRPDRRRDLFSAQRHQLPGGDLRPAGHAVGAAPGQKPKKWISGANCARVSPTPSVCVRSG